MRSRVIRAYRCLRFVLLSYIHIESKLLRLHSLCVISLMFRTTFSNLIPMSFRCLAVAKTKRSELLFSQALACARCTWPRSILFPIKYTRHRKEKCICTLRVRHATESCALAKIGSAAKRAPRNRWIKAVPRESIPIARPSKSFLPTAAVIFV